MGKFRPGKTTASSTATTIRRLGLVADRYLRDGNQTECIAIIAQIYDLFDALEMDLESDLGSQVSTAEHLTGSAATILM